MNTSIDEDFIGKVERFIEMLERIERIHKHWFESRHGVLKVQQHDVIGNHVVIDVNYPFLNFGYWHDSELPEAIRNECNRCYQQLFAAGS